MGQSDIDIKGVISVSTAYICWGLLTIFWNLLSGVNSLYILAQRVIWSMVFIGAYAIIIGRWPQIKQVFRSYRMLGLCLLCGVLITVNWGVYIYAVNSGHVLDASLGYFLEPVLVTVTGLLFFKERLNRREKITFACALVGLVYIVVATGTLPVLALAIALSFAAYGALKKKLPLDPYVSLFMETLMITPFALIFVAFSETGGTGALHVLHGWKILLLPACGIVTGIPLLMFNIGVRKIPYYMSGIIMYLNPTLQFFMGLFYFHEQLDPHQLVAFIIIWVGVGFTLWDKIAMIRSAARPAAAPAR